MVDLPKFPVREFVTDGEILRHLASDDVRTIMVVGGIDTGKTAFVYALARHLSEGSRVALVDLDVGQSHVGPPSTTGCGLFDPGRGEVVQVVWSFTGTFSPRGNLLPVLAGAVAVTRAARRRADKVIIDTTGYISDASARILKQQKIDVLSPDVVVGLEREVELAHILSPFLRCVRPKVIRIKASWPLSPKTIEKRFSYRMERLREYFSKGKVVEVRLPASLVRYTRYPPGPPSHSLEGRISSLRTHTNRDLVLALLLAGRVSKGSVEMKLYLPWKREYRFSHLLVGDARVVPAQLFRSP